MLRSQTVKIHTESVVGWRYRRSIKLFSGARINLSRSGASLSLGGRGATVNIGQKGTRATFGLPGTGLSYQTKLAKWDNMGAIPQQAPSPVPLTAQTAPKGFSLRIVAFCIIGAAVLWISLSGSPHQQTPSQVAADLGRGSTNANVVSGAQAGTVTVPGSADAGLARASAENFASSGLVRPERQTKTVTVRSAANIRNGPSVSADIVRVAKPDEVFTAFEKANGWVHVGNVDPIGWIAASLLKP
jgi:hypothetical protein